MTLRVDLYYTMRSPYCYLATPQLMSLVARYDLFINLKPVYPLAITDPTFFKRINPLQPPYLFKDTARIARRLNIPYRWPRPDPIVQDLATSVIADEQPYIQRLTCLAQAAAEQARGLAFVASVSGLLFNPDIERWDVDDHLGRAIAAAGLDAEELFATVEADTARLDGIIRRNRKDQLEAGHWGAPLFVHEQEVFFGQDRIVDLLWHLEQHGLAVRPPA